MVPAVNPIILAPFRPIKLTRGQGGAVEYLLSRPRRPPGQCRWPGGFCPPRVGRLQPGCARSMKRNPRQLVDLALGDGRSSGSQTRQALEDRKVSGLARFMARSASGCAARSGHQRLCDPVGDLVGLGSAAGRPSSGDRGCSDTGYWRGSEECDPGKRQESAFCILPWPCSSRGAVPRCLPWCWRPMCISTWWR